MTVSRVAQCTVILNPGSGWVVFCRERAVGERDTTHGSVEPTCEHHIALMERNGAVRVRDLRPAYRRWPVDSSSYSSPSVAPTDDNPQQEQTT